MAWNKQKLIHSAISLTRSVVGQRLIDACKFINAFGGEAYRNISRDICLRDQQAAFVHHISICAILKNEGAYIDEWVRFHANVGIDHFYLYDNGSTDCGKNVIEELQRQGYSIDYIYYPGEAIQIPAYEDCVRRYASNSKWIALIDLDEFLVPCNADSIGDVIQSYPSTAQFTAEWKIFGSNGHRHTPSGGVLKNFTKRMKGRCFRGKSIINPRRILKVGVHQSWMYGQTVFLNPAILSVNHYHCKSWEEYSLKAAKGDVAYGAAFGLSKYTMKQFQSLDRNDIDDFSALRFLDQSRA